MNATERQTKRTIPESARALLRGSAFAVLLALAGWVVTAPDVTAASAPSENAQKLQVGLKSHTTDSPEWLLPTSVDRPLAAARFNASRLPDDGGAAHRRLTFETFGVPHRLSAWLTGLQFHHDRQWHVSESSDRPVIATCPARGPPASA